MKKLLLFFATLCCCISMSAQRNQLNFTLGPNIECIWDFDTETMVVKGSGAMYDLTYNESIYRISGRKNYSDIQSLVIEEGITNIGSWVFNNLHIKSVTLPSTITKIGDNAFASCAYIEDINFPDNIKYIGENAFAACQGLTNIKLPANLVAIRAKAFTYCEYLEGIEIPSGCTSIGEKAFEGCHRMKTLSIPKTMASIYDDAFKGCTALESITVEEGGNFYTGENGKNVIIDKISGENHDKRTLIKGCRKSGDLGEMQLDSIAPYAFEKAFKAEIRYTEVYLPEYRDIVIPEGVTGIGEYAFAGCDLVSGFNLPNSLKYISDGAFKDCDNWFFYDLALPANLKYIGKDAFRNCNRIRTLISYALMPPVLGDYADYIFEGVSAYALKVYECSKSAYVHNWSHFVNINTMPMPDDLPVGKCGDDLWWHYADGTLSVFGRGNMWDFEPTTVPWKDYRPEIKNLELSEGMYNIGKYAFSALNITSVTTPVWCTTIGDLAFIACDKLKEVNMLDPVNIGKWAFSDCTSLTSIKFPKWFRTIGDMAFYNCKKLSEVEFCQGEEGHLESIGEMAFMNCESLREITLPQSLQQLGTDIFTNCEQLESVIFNCNLTELSDGLFVRCRALSDIDIPEGITRIGKFCFSQCDGLEYIDLPSSVTLLDDQAFYYCKHLKSVACRASNPPTMGQRVFYGAGASLAGAKPLIASANDDVEGINGPADDVVLYVPAESIPLYKAAEGWKEFSVVDDVKNFNDNGGDTPIDPNDKVGRPMEPIKPDLNQYTHKMMVLGAPWGIEDLCMAILRDNDGRVVQKMTMRIDGDNLSAHMTDSVRTYTYEDNKMIEDLAVPYYDENDVLHMEKIFRTTTSYYRLAEGHREVIEKARFEHDEYVASGEREEYIFDSEGRKVSYKKYYGDELEAELDYTYDENGGCLGRGKYDGYSNYSGYTRYDENGNLRGKTEWGTYYEYFYDNQNHYQGYKYYYDYNFDDHTYGKVHDDNYFEILETYADGSAKKMKRKGDGEVRTFSRAGNVETQINTPTYGSPVTITRTFDDQGRIVAKTSTNRTFKSNYIYSDLSANQVLGAVNTFDEDLHTNYEESVNWTYSNPLSATSYEYTFWGIDEKAFTTYNIVPLSVLPAQTTEEGVAISVGNAGDKVVLSNEGEIYLLDKGGKKRYSVSVSGINVSSEGGKIVVTGWTPISFAASAKGVSKAPETIDLTTNEYDIYIPENVITINGKSLNEVYLPISLDENGATGIVEVKNDVKSTNTDGRLYNLQGIQVKTPEKGQIVIINGKKVVVK